MGTSQTQSQSNKTIDRKNHNTPPELAEGVSELVTKLKDFNAKALKDDAGNVIAPAAIKQLEGAKTTPEYHKAFTRIFIEQIQSLVKLGKLPEEFLTKGYKVPGSSELMSLQQILKDGDISEREYKYLAFIPDRGRGQNFNTERAVVKKNGNYIIEQIELDIIAASKAGKINFQYTNDRNTCPDQTKFGILQLVPHLERPTPTVVNTPIRQQYVPTTIYLKVAPPVVVDLPVITGNPEATRALEKAGFYNRDRDQIVIPRGKENDFLKLIYLTPGFGPKAVEACCKVLGCPIPAGLGGGGVGTGGGPGTGSS